MAYVHRLERVGACLFAAAISMVAWTAVSCGSSFTAAGDGAADATGGSNDGPDASSVDGSVVDGLPPEGSPADGSAEVGPAASCTMPDGGYPNQPGKIDCGGMQCVLDAGGHQYVCCQSRLAGPDGGIVATCTDSPCDPVGNKIFECQQPGDCPSGQVCCRDTMVGNLCTAPIQCTAANELCRCNENCSSGHCTVCPKVNGGNPTEICGTCT